jgi:hypothetical protein
MAYTRRERETRKKPGGGSAGDYPGQVTMGNVIGLPGSYPITKDGHIDMGRVNALLSLAHHIDNNSKERRLKEATADYLADHGYKKKAEDIRYDLNH